MIDFAARHVGTADRRCPVWIESRIRKCDYGPYSIGERPPGCAYVDHDSKRYFYHVNRNEAGAFRQWAANAFTGNNDCKLTGRYPAYSVC